MMTGASTVEEAHCILSILNDFSETSCTTINTKKSKILFFNTPRAIQSHITHFLGFTRISPTSKYLGIPLIDNALRNSSWEGFLEAISSCISSWTFHTLNLASFLVLLKSLLQDIPIYMFLALDSPKFMLKYVKKIQRKLLWKGSKEGRKWALVNWKTFCNPK
jgi:hypothetical protein